MKKNDILKALDNLGFTVDEFGGHYYHFEYEETNYLYNYDESDENFLFLSIPNIFAATDDNAELLMPIINQVNNIIKYAKITYAEEMVWATFEYPLFKWVNLEELLEYAIRVLQSAAHTFNRVLRGDFDTEREEEVA